MRHHPFLLAASSLALVLASAAAHAQSQVVGQHPAVTPGLRTATAIDPNLFLVQPPASVQWVHAHSNGEHPAVLVAARLAARTVDANQFIVQPPAAVRWTLAPLPNIDVADISDGAALR